MPGGRGVQRSCYTLGFILILSNNKRGKVGKLSYFLSIRSYTVLHNHNHILRRWAQMITRIYALKIPDRGSSWHFCPSSCSLSNLWQYADFSFQFSSCGADYNQTSLYISSYNRVQKITILITCFLIISWILPSSWLNYFDKSTTRGSIIVVLIPWFL